MNLQASAARRRPFLTKFSIFQIFKKNYVAVQLGRCKFIFRCDIGIRKRRARIRRENDGGSNEFTDFENFEVEGVARLKTISAMQAVNRPGAGITLETTALRVT